MATSLIVDDRHINRKFLVTLLGYAGHRLLEADDGMDALRCTRAQRPDLIVTDVLMPTMDGVEFTRRLHAEPAIAHIPVIFYTATYRSDETSKLAQSCGAAAVLVKPSEPQIILATVNAVLGIRQPPAQQIPPVVHYDDNPLQPGVVVDDLSARLRELEELNLGVMHTIERGLRVVGGRNDRSVASGDIARSLTTVRAVSLRLSALVELGLTQASHYDPLYVLDMFCRAAQDILSAKYAAIGVLDEKGQRLKHLFVRGMARESAALLGSLHPLTGVFGEALVQGRPQRIRGLDGDPRSVGLPAAHPPIHSFLVVPILLPGGPYGWLYVADKLGAVAFDDDDERFAMTLAAQLAGAQENLMLYEQIRGQSKALEQEVAERKRAEAEVRRLNADLEDRIRQRTAQLEMANKELEAFSYSVSHDLRAPLRAVSGSAEILIKDHATDLNDEAQNHLNRIVRATTYMGRLIEDLLRYARLGRSAVKLEPVSLAVVLTRIVESFSQRIAEIDARVAVANDLPTVPGDRALLDQVFTNLLDNALNYRRHDAKVEVAVTWAREGDDVVISIADNGIGIPPECLDKVFVMFWRQRAQDKYVATGIGLALVKKSIELLGGKVWAEALVDRGSTFHIRLQDNPDRRNIERDEAAWQPS